MVESEDTRQQSRVAELPSQEEDAQYVAPINFDAMETEELFHKLEKTVVGYEEYQNAFEAHYMRTIEGLKKLVSKIQQ